MKSDCQRNGGGAAAPREANLDQLSLGGLANAIEPLTRAHVHSFVVKDGRADENLYLAN